MDLAAVVGGAGALAIDVHGIAVNRDRVEKVLQTIGFGCPPERVGARRLAPQWQMLAKKVEMRLGPSGRRVPSVTAGDLRQQQDGQQTEDRMLDVAPAVVLDPGKDPTNSRQHALSPTGLNACGYGRQITAA